MERRISSMSLPHLIRGSMSGRFVRLFLVLVLLIVLLGWITMQVLEAQQNQGVLLDQARHQRSLVETMAHEAAEYEREPIRANGDHLVEAMRDFEATLSAWQVGQPGPDSSAVAALSEPAIVSRLALTAGQWRALRPVAGALLSRAAGDPQLMQDVADLQSGLLALLTSLDGTLAALEESTTARLQGLLWLHSGLLLLALLVIGGSFILTYRRIILPFQSLESAAERIGHGDLQSPVRVHGSSEIRRLASRLEVMRQQLLASRDGLEAQVAARTQELEALQEVTQELASRLEIEHLLGSVVDHARRLLGSTWAALCLLDEQGKTLQVAAESGQPAPGSGPLAPARRPAGPLVFPREQIFCPANGEQAACPLEALSRDESHLVVPVRVQNRLTGALCVAGARTLSGEEGARALLQKLAGVTAVALNNAQLYAQAERVAALEERERLAAEIHDGIAQTFSYLHLQVDQIIEELACGADPGARLGRMREVLAAQARDVRAAIATLRRTASVPQPLAEQLRQAVASSLEGAGWHADSGAVELLIHDDFNVLPDVAVEIRGIVQEAVMNVCHHAEASHILVELSRDAGGARLAVVDDGSGFAPDKPPEAGRPHFGLSIMAARAIRIGGQLVVDSQPGRGTRIELRWPLEGGSYASC